MEFIPVAHAVIVGMAVAEILRGIADIVCSWSQAGCCSCTCRSGGPSGGSVPAANGPFLNSWSSCCRSQFPNVIARLCFPEELAESGLEAYYPRVAPVIFLLVAATYASFALLLQPFIVGGIDPPVFVSQPVLVVLAVVAGGCESPASRFVVLAAMISQAAWRGLSGAIGNRAIATGGFVSNGFSSGNGGRFDASPRSKGSLGQWERL